MYNRQIVGICVRDSIYEIPNHYGKFHVTCFCLQAEVGFNTHAHVHITVCMALAHHYIMFVVISTHRCWNQP